MERYSWAVGIDENTGLITVEDARLSMSALITPTGLITSRTGFIPAADEPGEVTATSPTPNGSVHVAPFRAVMQSGRGGGTYLWCLDETKSFDVLATEPADPANARIDLIVLQQSDTFFSDPDSDFVVRHIVGDPAAVPVDPDVDGSEDYLIRARITVPAGATSLDDGDIANVAVPWTVAAGGLLPVRSQAERDAITNPFPGMQIDRLDRHWVEVHDGTAWRVHAVAICGSVADRNTAITHPRSGQLAITTDSDSLWQYDGLSSAWHPLYGIVGGRDISGTNNLGTTSTTTELNPTSMNSGNIQLQANTAYRIKVRYKVVGGVANDLFLHRIRIGTTAGITGTIIADEAYLVRDPGTGVTATMEIDYENGASVLTRVFSFTSQRIGGSGSITYSGGATGVTSLVGVRVYRLGAAGLVTQTAS